MSTDDGRGAPSTSVEITETTIVFHHRDAPAGQSQVLNLDSPAPHSAVQEAINALRTHGHLVLRVERQTIVTTKHEPVDLTGIYDTTPQENP